MAASTFAGVAGHQAVVRRLEAQVETGRLPHAYLFSGESQLGKTTVARAFAAALLPEAPLHRHPDFWEDDRHAAIKMDEIRLIPDKGPEAHSQTMHQFISQKPAIATRRVALISNVGRMADVAQNLLLKTLEEPHPNRVIILTSSSTSAFVVLPTVVSRCRRVSFSPVPDGEVRDLLLERGVEPENAIELARLARGRTGWALDAAQDPAVLARHRDWEEKLVSIFGGPAHVAIDLATQMDGIHFQWRGSDKEGGDPLLEAFGAWQLELRRRMLTDAHPARWARLLELSYDALGYHEQNVSPRLNLEVFLLQCRRAS